MLLLSVLGGSIPSLCTGVWGSNLKLRTLFFSDEAHTVRDFRLPVSHVSVDAGRSCQVFIKIMLGLCF